MTPDEQDVHAQVSRWVDPGALRDLERRVDGGRATYGGLEIHTDKRSYLAEACEELADCAWYLGAEVVRRRRDGHDYGMVALCGAFVGVVWRQLRGLVAWGG